MGWQGDLWRRPGKIHIYVESRREQALRYLAGVFQATGTDGMQSSQISLSMILWWRWDRQLRLRDSRNWGSRNYVAGPGTGSSFQTPSPLFQKERVLDKCFMRVQTCFLNEMLSSHEILGGISICVTMEHLWKKWAEAFAYASSPTLAHTLNLSSEEPLQPPLTFCASGKEGLRRGATEVHRRKNRDTRRVMTRSAIPTCS